MPSADLILRQLLPDDAPAVNAMHRKVNWLNPLAQQRQHITWGGAGSLCLCDGERIVATSVNIVYSPVLAWIGMVVTDPDYQRQGLARRIMRASLEYLEQQGVQTIMLDASAFGYGLYTSLNFRDVFRIEVSTGIAHSYPEQNGVRPATQADLPRITELDAAVFGVERPQVARWWLESGASLVHEDEGLITGYIFRKAIGNTNRFGPWYDRTPLGAERLLKTALSSIEGQPTRVDLVSVNAPALTVARQCGLDYASHVTRMALGGVQPGQMQDFYGVASFTTG
jgi:predicted N-acetyltransferase YhbS